MFGAKEKNINSFKSKIFAIKNLDKTPTYEPPPEPAPTPKPDPTVFDTSK